MYIPGYDDWKTTPPEEVDKLDPYDNADEEREIEQDLRRRKAENYRKYEEELNERAESIS
ncbi:hypothetical protein ACTQ6A_02870 [Lachnospiraceae bacterium LCP25S3_G4]